MNKGKIIAPIILLSLFALSVVPSQPSPELTEAKLRPLYLRAESLYNLQEPTVQSDSIALSLYLQVASKLEQASSASAMLIDCYLKAGNIRQTYSEHAQARAFYFQSIGLNQKPVRDTVLLYLSYLYLGSSYYFNNIIDSAKLYFEDASLMVEKLNRNNLPDLYRLYNSLGAIYFQSGNYLQAKNYFLLSLTHINKQSPDYDYTYVSVVSNIATCEQETGNLSEAIRLYNSLLKMQARQDIIKQSLAHTYFKKGEYDSSMWLLKNSTLGESIHKIKALNDLGKISEQQHSWAAAEAYYDSALALNKKLFGKLKNRERGISYQNKALLAQQRGLTNEAVYWCNRALEELHINFAADNLKDLPDQSQNSVSPIITFEVLKLKADLFLQKYKNDSNKTNLYDAVQTYKAAFAEANYIKRTFDNDDARLFFNTNYQELYRNALGAAFEAASLDEANVDILIFLLENYKGTILSHNITLQQLKAKSSISEKDLAYEKHLKDLISIYSNRINATEVSQDEEPMRKRYVELQVELSRLQKKFENDIAFNYYRYQQGTEQLSLDKLQEKLDNNTAIVNFFCDNQFVHSICISSNRYIISKVPYDSAFRNHLGQLVNALRDQTEGKRYSGIYDSHQLFRQLLQPLRAVWDSREKIVVLPDGVLNLLPFDALSLSAKAPRYLVREKTLSYHYSYTLLTANHHPNETGQLHNATAFAPFSGKDSNIAARRLAILSSSAAELKDLTGTIAKGSQASKGFFLQQTGNSSLVHLATHAYMNDTLKNNGWIEFYPASANPDSNRLYLSEIYNLNLSKASLVVLSACETAAGLNLAGEGLLSLSRAFLYAGASSVISTLWKTEDKATAFLMSKFYEHMQQGLSKEEALRQAKCDLMDSDEVSPVLKSPNYWSNFVLVGEIKPGSQSIGQWLSYRWKWIVFIGLMLFGALYWNQVQNSRKTKDAAAEG